MRKKPDRFGSLVRMPGRRGWWFRKRLEGRSHLRFAGDRKAEAEQYRARVWARVQDGHTLEAAMAYAVGEEAPRPGGPTTFSALVDLYLAAPDQDVRKTAKTRASDAYRAETLKAAPWAADAADRVDRGAVRAWVVSRLQEGARAGSVQNDLTLASAILKHAQAAGWLDEDAPNPFLKARLKRIERAKRVGLDLAEFAHFLDTARDVAEPEAYLLFLAAGYTGWRLGDFVGLRREDVYLDAKPAPYMQTWAGAEKTGKTKRAYLVPELAAALEALLAEDGLKRLGAAPVFRRPDGGPWTSQTARKRLRAVLDACDREKVPAWKIDGDLQHKRFDFHSLKHTARNVLRELGFDVYAINAQVGHSTLSMANLYTTVGDAELARMARVVGDRVRKKRKGRTA